MQSLDRGNQENILDTYFLTLKKLKDNVSKLFEKYLHILNEKVDCDSGKLLYCYTKPLCTSISEALNRVDELEIQLHGIDSWFELPVIQPSYQSGDLDRVSDDAQELIEIVKQFQSALHSVVTPKRPGDANASLNDPQVAINYPTDEKFVSFPRSLDFHPPAGTTSPSQFLHQQRLPLETSNQQLSYLVSETGYIQDNPEPIIPSLSTEVQLSHASERLGEFGNLSSLDSYPSIPQHLSRQIVRGITNERIIESTGQDFDESSSYLPSTQAVNQVGQEQLSSELSNPNKMTRTSGSIQYQSSGNPATTCIPTPLSNISPSYYKHPKSTSEHYN